MNLQWRAVLMFLDKSSRRPFGPDMGRWPTGERPIGRDTPPGRSLRGRTHASPRRDHSCGNTKDVWSVWSPSPSSACCPCRPASSFPLTTAADVAIEAGTATAATTTGAVTTDTMATGRADGRERAAAFRGPPAACTANQRAEALSVGLDDITPAKLRPMLSLRSDIGCRRPG